MNNKYSVACITLVRDKYKINTDGICVVYTADWIWKLDSKSNRTADLRFDSDAKKTIRRSLISKAHILKESHSFTCTPRVHPLTEWTIPAFAFPAEAGKY